MTPTDINPPYDLFGQYAKIAKGTTANLKKMREAAIYTDGRIPARLKSLAAMLWSISARCEPCITHYAAKAKELGATEEELGEFLALATTMGGCVGETWAVKAYAAYKGGVADATACCP